MPSFLDNSTGQDDLPDFTKPLDPGDNQPGQSPPSAGRTQDSPPAGLWKVKAHDLSLLPGVPVLDSNPTAQPYSPAAKASVANAGGGAAPGGNAVASPAAVSGNAAASPVAASPRPTLEEAEPDFGWRPYDSLVDAGQKGLLPGMKPADLDEFKKQAWSVQQRNMAGEGLGKPYFFNSEGKFFPGGNDPVASVDSAMADGVLDSKTGMEMRKKLAQGEPVDFEQYNPTYRSAEVHGNNFAFNSGIKDPQSHGISRAGAQLPAGVAGDSTPGINLQGPPPSFAAGIPIVPRAAPPEAGGNSPDVTHPQPPPPKSAPSQPQPLVQQPQAQSQPQPNVPGNGTAVNGNSGVNGSFMTDTKGYGARFAAQQQAAAQSGQNGQPAATPPLGVVRTAGRQRLDNLPEYPYPADFRPSFPLGGNDEFPRAAVTRLDEPGRNRIVFWRNIKGFRKNGVWLGNGRGIGTCKYHDLGSYGAVCSFYNGLFERCGIFGRLIPWGQGD